MRSYWSRNSLLRKKSVRSGHKIKRQNKRAESELADLEPTDRIDSKRERATQLAEEILRNSQDQETDNPT